MAYNAFTNSEIQVGKAIKKELWQKVKDNFDDHETRLAQAISGSSKVEVFNLDFRLPSYYTSLNGIIYHECLQNMSLIQASILIYEKGSISSGILSIDVFKNSTPDSVGALSVFTSAPSLDYSSPSVVDYSKAFGTFNTTNQNVLAGDILRLDVTSIPLGVRAFRILLIGEV